MYKWLPLIYYHSVAPRKNPAWVKNFLTLPMSYFEQHLKFFKENKYTFIKLKDVPDLSPAEAKKKKFINLSFDDGYLDNYIYVYPLLKKYNANATFFVNPNFVDKRPLVRKTIEDYWNGKSSMEEIEKWGFASWKELRLMEESGVVDIQSHTMTHLKYFISDKITRFHKPGADSLYPIGTLFPERLPYYIEDKEFEKLIPYGTPIFESESSATARKVNINTSFTSMVVDRLKNIDWSSGITTAELLNKIKPEYDEFKRKGEIIQSVETGDEYKSRVHCELKESKEIIEKEIDKKVEICCWPHGDSNSYAHNTAISLGYRATTTGNVKDGSYRGDDETRLPPRIGLAKDKYSSVISKLRVYYKVNSLEKNFPYYNVDKLYKKLKYGIDI